MSNKAVLLEVSPTDCCTRSLELKASQPHCATPSQPCKAGESERNWRPEKGNDNDCQKGPGLVSRLDMISSVDIHGGGLRDPYKADQGFSKDKAPKGHGETRKTSCLQ